jgi:hypothetical protein
VQFDGDVIPASYLQGEYYVEGVGTAIELVSVNNLISPEQFTQGEYIPWDMAGWDIGNYDINLYLPVEQDYITIARNSINRNAWSRSNRWFHIDVIQATATYNNTPEVINLASGDNKARRPIIEFYPNLKLWNSGAIGKDPVDFIDMKATDALSTVSGSLNYYPDIQVYTTATATITASPTTPVAPSTFVPGTSYEISTLGTTTNWNTIAGTTSQTYIVGDTVLCVVAGTGNGLAIPLATSTTVTVPVNAVTGAIEAFMYIGDSANILPNNSIITALTSDGTDYTMTVTI